MPFRNLPFHPFCDVDLAGAVQLKSKYSQRTHAADKCAELTVIKSVWRQMSQNLTRTFAAIQTGFVYTQTRAARRHPAHNIMKWQMQNGSLSLTRSTAQYCVGEGMSTGENYGLRPRQGASNFCIFSARRWHRKMNTKYGNIFADALHVCRPTAGPLRFTPAPP